MNALTLSNEVTDEKEAIFQHIGFLSGKVNQILKCTKI